MDFIKMNSEERRMARYERRKAKRNREVVHYDECFTFNHIWISARRCFKSVSWKTSVKNYKRKAFSNVGHAYIVLRERKHIPEKPYCFTIHNRGKERNVEGLSINERVIQKTFSDFGLVPLVSKSLIYDNCATLKNKGMWFCLKRLKKRYNDFMHKYGDTGYILILDFHNYFYSIDHEILYGLIKRFMDDDCFKFYCDIVDNMKGLNLGSQLSQISAVFFAHRFDEVCQNHSIYYARYMDDSYCMFKCKKDLMNALNDIMNVVESLGLEINPKKVKIIKASNGFTFLKKKIRYDDKVIITPKREFDRVILTKMKKLKKLNPYAIHSDLICYRPFYAKYNGYHRYLKIIHKL